MRAKVKFTGVINGVEKTFDKGDTITTKEAKELDLKNKPDLVYTEQADSD